ncbi:transcriptional regulator with XRE-family HTH domain [Spinactinospora alkalitolerans]|uniref:Transcriptional regulator with XRE-family HTH domain n=1 Tax=Spinactinospora alkalitolerans TaxID=687207 RepID=A0A852TSK4_9ACTN|nr:helix-turn-helix transcriptional regulator [Spinactinospora alkalitolerans]NYE46918.1 transcriptional regulator with XRE-family HTH domain [Spinactinospora alkalitolerans]
MAAALASCDMAAIVEAIRLSCGWSQAELARSVGYSQSWVSRVVNGQQSLTLDQVRQVAHRLDIPVHLLRFASSGPIPAPTAPPRPAAVRAAGEGKGADPTRRRDFGKAVAMTALPLPAAPGCGDIDETTALTLRAITGGQRRLDASSPARDLAKAAVAHLELSGRTLARARRTPFAADVAAAASEAAGFAAWLHADMGDAGSARSYYRTAVERARQSGHGLLDVYMLGSLASFEIDAEDPELGLTLAVEAGRRMGDDAHPTAQAWLACVRALGRAGMGDAAAAHREIARAEAAVRRPDNAAPPWPWVFAFDDAKVAGYRALAAVRLRRPGDARTAFSDAFGGTRPGAKQGAVLLVELATAHADAGDVDEAFRLASEALRTGAAFRSERIIGRVRRFRRGYRGPRARCVSALDEQLTALLTGGSPPAGRG